MTTSKETLNPDFTESANASEVSYDKTSVSEPASATNSSLTSFEDAVEAMHSEPSYEALANLTKVSIAFRDTIFMDPAFSNDEKKELASDLYDRVRDQISDFAGSQGVSPDKFLAELSMSPK